MKNMDHERPIATDQSSVIAEPRHTPGPWVGFVDRSTDAAIFSILPAGRTGEIASNIENEADASLITAAPDLLAVLKAYLAARPQCKCTDRSGCAVARARVMARAAIAKAEGRS